MKECRTNRSGNALLPATATSKGLGYFQLGSEQSRAAARSLMTARQKSEAEEDWDKELDCTGIAESLSAAREIALQETQLEVSQKDWSPIHIPPGKEDTVRGRFATRLNEARARIARLRTEGSSSGLSDDDTDNLEGKEGGLTSVANVPPGVTSDVQVLSIPQERSATSVSRIGRIELDR